MADFRKCLILYYMQLKPDDVPFIGQLRGIVFGDIFLFFRRNSREKVINVPRHGLCAVYGRDSLARNFFTAASVSLILPGRSFIG